MANQTITKTPDAYANARQFSASNWTTSNVYPASLEIIETTNREREVFYKVTVAELAVAVSACSLEVLFSNNFFYDPGAVITCYLTNVDPVANTFQPSSAIASLTFTNTDDGNIYHKFNFSSLNVSETTLYFVLVGTLLCDIRCSSPTASVTFAYPELGVSVSPSQLEVPGNVSLAYTNRYGQSLRVQFLYNSTVLYSFTESGDGSSVSCESNWFETAGVTGDSMRVTVSVSDDLGRTASAQLTVTRAGLTVEVSPADVPAGGDVAVTVGGERAIIRFLYNNTVLSGWNNVYAYRHTVNCPASWFTAAGVSGNSMRVTVQASDGSRTASTTFTLSLSELTVGVTPSELYAGSDVKVSIGGLYGMASVRFSYNGSTLLDYNTSSKNTTVTAAESWFDTAGVSGNSMRVTVSATDSVGNRTASANFTLKRPTGLVSTPTAPKSTTVDGAGSINFAWSTSGDGTQTQAQLQWSRDNAAWTDLATISGGGKTWTAPTVNFPAGTIYWRVRVYSSFDLWGAWSNSVSFTVKYDAVSQVIPVNTPTSGIINAAVDRTFSVGLDKSGPVYDPFTVAAATLYWRAGESGDYTAVTMTPDGSTASATIPANTFQSGTIQWYASATDNTDRTTKTEVYTLSVLRATVEATPLSPINTVESGSGPILFRWTYGSLDGTPQSRAELQYRTDSTGWTNFADGMGTETNYTAPAETFEGGTIYWRVRAYNQGGDVGPWSEAVSFISFAAPHVAGVSGDGKPFLTVSWQVTGQLAYELEVDGKTYGPCFGADARSYTLPEPLADGLYTVRVRAQNKYGLWSEWAEGNVSVVNVPGPSFFPVAVTQDPNIVVRVLLGTGSPTILKQPQDVQGTSGTVRIGLNLAQFGNNYPSRQWYYRDPGGEWQKYTGSGATSFGIIITCSQDIDGRQFRCRVYNAVGEIYSRAATYRYLAPNGTTSPLIEGEFHAETGYFLIYRDGVLIGKTFSDSFTDRTALGTHQYELVQILGNGYYTRNTTGEASVSVDCPMIGLLAGGDFLALRLSTNADREQSFSRNRQVVYTYYSGAAYPEAEIGEQETLTGSYDVAFLATDVDGAAAFEAMLGKAVILKAPGGTVIVGILEGWERRDPHFFKSYSFSVRQMDWRDYVDA